MLKAALLFVIAYIGFAHTGFNPGQEISHILDTTPGASHASPFSLPQGQSVNSILQSSSFTYNG